MVVEPTVDAIAFRIASGTYRAGERLPSVRGLAAEFAINPSTAQVVLARLESLGFVVCRPGFGALVRDLDRHGGIASWRYLFRFAQRIPQRAGRVLAELLEMRRVLVIDAIAKVAAAPRRHDPAPLRRAVERMALRAGRAAERGELARAEVEALRELLLATGQSVVTAVLNSIAEVYLEAPAVVAAMCARPEENLLGWRALLARWERGEPFVREAYAMRAVLAQHDAAVLARFQREVARPAKESRAAAARPRRRRAGRARS